MRTWGDPVNFGDPAGRCKAQAGTDVCFEVESTAPAPRDPGPPMPGLVDLLFNQFFNPGPNSRNLPMPEHAPEEGGGRSYNGGLSQEGVSRKSGNVFSCASEFASKYGIAGALQRFGIGTGGVGGFVTNALGGNAFSGLTDLVQSFGSGEAGGHNVFYNMDQGVAAGPTQGFGAAFGKSIEGTSWGSGPVDVATAALVAKGFSVATGAGQTIQTLNGAARLGSLGVDAGEVASGVGTLKLIYDAASYAVGLVRCY
jgi:hypothetical protein